MKTTILVFLLLSVFFTLLVAQPARLSREEEDRRSKELRALGEQFKKETGFQGTFTYDVVNNKLTQFDGYFPDIKFPPANDTLQVRQVFDELTDKMLPYLPATKEQLSIRRIGGDERTLSASYIQKINGYSFEGAGTFGYVYRYKSGRITIGNSFVNVDPSTLAAEPVITEEEVREMFNNSVIIPEEELRYADGPPHVRLMYCYLRDNDPDFPLIPYQYRLSWQLSFLGYFFIVDAITGEILFNKEVVMYETETYNGNGTSNNSF